MGSHRARTRSNRLAPDVEKTAREMWLDPNSTLTNLDIEIELGISWKRIWSRFGRRPIEASKRRRAAEKKRTSAIRGRAIRRAVAASELTMNEIAHELGCSRTTIYQNLPGGRRGLLAQNALSLRKD